MDENGEEQIRIVEKVVEIEKTTTVEVEIPNPIFDPDASNNKNWAKIGLIGQLRVRDDGTCQANGYCTVADGGIATATEDSSKGYRVLERINDHLIRILFR